MQIGCFHQFGESSAGALVADFVEKACIYIVVWQPSLRFLFPWIQGSGNLYCRVYTFLSIHMASTDVSSKEIGVLAPCFPHWVKVI